MEFPEKYKCLSQRIFQKGQYWIQPIRFETHLEIMKWRNDQIKFLRQEAPLTEADQLKYFSLIIKKLYEVDEPGQLLFNFYQGQELIGYGGLVHIDWKNLNAEISFILDSAKNTQDSYLEKFSFFLQLIEKASRKLNLHKIFTYGYNIVEYRFKPLEELDYLLEANLIDHNYINDKLYDVRIYSKIL
jgi:RimJ/RimL family protein N-acetyltransferase